MNIIGISEIQILDGNKKKTIHYGLSNFKKITGQDMADIELPGFILVQLV